MLKLIAVDLDNTLVQHKGGKKVVLEKDIAAIKEFEQTGGIVAIASGRNFHEVKKFSDEYKIGSYYICSNGAYCCDVNNNEIFSAYFTDEAIDEILTAAEKYHVYRIVADDQTYYCENHNKLLSILEKRAAVFHVNSPCVRKEFVNTQSVRKVMFLGSTWSLKKLQQTINERFPQFQAMFTSKYSLEVMQKTTTKGQALKIIMERLHIAKEQTGAIGDNENDISMFQEAAVAFTFPNSSKKVKQHASTIVRNVAELFRYEKI